MNKPNSGDSAPTNTHEDQIRADRACIKCGFNLFGQSVYREPHYNLAIARCPECGEVAALQTYPVMSHWANRFRAIIAGVWVLVLIVFFIIQTSLSGSYAHGTSYTAAQQLGRTIGQEYTEWAQQNGQTVTNHFSAVGNNPYYEWVNIPRSWADEYVPGLIDQSDPWRELINSGFITSLLPAVMMAFILGIFWSIVLLGASRKRAALAPILAAAIALIFMFSPDFIHYGPMQASMVAQSYYAELVAPWVLLIQLPFSLMGVFVGRKVARWVITLTLPPRTRIPLSIFWTRDGLPPPKPTIW